MFAITPFGMSRRFSGASPRRVSRDFDDFFDRIWWAPNFNGNHSFREFDLYEKDGKLFLSLEAAGMNPDDVEIRIFKDKVSIKSNAEAEEKQEEDGKTWYNRKSVCSFNYEITLPFEIDTESAEAKFDQGLIHVTANRLERSESKVLSLKKD